MRLLRSHEVLWAEKTLFWERIQSETMFRPFASQDDFFFQVHHDENIWWFLEIDGKIVGMSMVRGWYEGWDEKVLGVYVVPEYRGQGLAALLCLAAIADARERGLNSVRLHVNPNNGPALSLYGKLDFLRSNDTHNGEYVMRKEL